MITKAVVRRQLENGVLTNIQTLTFNGDELLSISRDNTPYCANKIEEIAKSLGMTVTNECNAPYDGAEIHIATWVK